MVSHGHPRTSGGHHHSGIHQLKLQELQQLPRRNFNAENGQVFHESEVVFRSKNATNWAKAFRTPSLVRKSKTAPIGARSLFDMARSKCVDELGEFSSELFESVPWDIACGLWEEVVTRHMETFQSWRLLASAYSAQQEFGKPEGRYHLALKQAPLPLTEYYRGLTSTQRLWHVAIRMSPKQNTTSDLVALSQVTNLAVLDLSDGQLLLDSRPCVFDFRIMRTWAELAASGRSFSDLRVLMFGWQDSLSDWLFDYLDAFPSLHYVIVTDCKDLHQKNRSQWEGSASQKGWTALHAKRSAKALRPLLDDQTFQVGNVSNLYYHSYNVMQGGGMDANVEFTMRPVAECWIGTPRSWTHIIDEFPSTRTIWFERDMRPRQSTDSPEVPKRVRDKTNPPDATPSPPAKKVQRQMKTTNKQKLAMDAKKMLAEMGR